MIGDKHNTEALDVMVLRNHGVVEEHSKYVEARWRLTVERLEERMQT